LVGKKVEYLLFLKRDRIARRCGSAGVNVHYIQRGSVSGSSISKNIGSDSLFNMPNFAKKIYKRFILFSKTKIVKNLSVMFFSME
jgi:hypothetical protein